MTPDRLSRSPRPLSKTPQPWPPYNPLPIWTSNTGDQPMYRSLDYSCGDNPGGISHCSMGESTSTPRGMSHRHRKGACGESFSLNASLSLQDGCTVEGHSTGQSFYTTFVDYEESATVLKVFLQGHESSEEIPEVVAPPRKTNKGRVIDDLEAENEELRRKIAELENEKLKKQLESLQE